MSKTLHRLTHGEGRKGDADYLVKIADNIPGGRTICAFGEACSWPVQSFVAKFKDEFVAKGAADEERRHPKGFSNDQFNRAFAEFQEFGPQRRIPVEQRWRDNLQDINPAEFETLRTRCAEIETFAFGLVKQVESGKLKEDAARRQLAQTYPFLTAERVAHTWSQAVYFSSK